jgi:hypothetical protein
VKKLIVFLMAIALCACLFVGCNSEPEVSENVSKSSSFVIVGDAYGYNIVYHKDTKVMYVYSTSSGNFCLLVNPDGTPMIWEGE